jgi:glycosyltransferase involved in cell wall biosynthesis
MRIFQISKVSPAARGDGGSSATFATLQALCRAGHEITYAYLQEGSRGPDSEASVRLTDRCGGNLRLLPLSAGIPSMSRPLRMMRTLLGACWRMGPRGCLDGGLRPRKMALRAWRLGCAATDPFASLRRRIETILAQSSYDVIQVDYPAMLRVGSRLVASRPRVFVAYEIQAAMAEQEYPHDRRYCELVGRHESAELRRYDAVLTLSEEDAATLRTRLLVDRVYCSPLAIDCQRIGRPRPRSPESGAVRFTFVGGYRHAPNADAVAWLCREIVPRLRTAFPGMKVEVIGRYPAGFARKYSGPEVSFLGFVEDFDELVSGSIFLCPVRLASGMRIKILDAVLRGAAVISTTTGAGGLGFVPDVHYLVADSPEAFCRQARRLVENDLFRQEICRRAQEHVLSVFSPEAVAKTRAAALEAVVASSPSPSGRWSG